ncbi:MAG: hypothetical protein QOI64_1710, partial [Solirubrobacteraceae bacterium]|nr:hypothetical protein [Solirubrobacteraceae bacterium]
MTPILSSTLLRTQSDARLARLAAQGHERAFEAIVERYRRALHAYCRRLLPHERAEDVVQQALLNAWSALRRGDEVRDLRPWLYRIAHNTSLNALRRSGYDYDELRDSLRGADSPSDDYERRTVIRETLAGVASLPDRQREALLRTAFEGASHEEIARDLGLTDGAVRQLVHRARTTLRAAATAITPLPLVGWAASIGRAASGEGSERIAELAAGAGSAGIAGGLIKAGAVVIAAGTLATGGLVASGGPSGHRPDAASAATQAASPGTGSSTGGAGSTGDRTARAGLRPVSDRTRRRSGTRRRHHGGTGPLDLPRRDGSDDGSGDRRGSGDSGGGGSDGSGGKDGSDDPSGDDHGSGTSGSGDLGEDHSGTGSGSGDDSSGPGSGTSGSGDDGGSDGGGSGSDSSGTGSGS